MPQIPLYNKGLGSTTRMATGQLSPRANVQALTSGARAQANFFDTASKVAYEFGEQEKRRETNRIYSEEYLRLQDEGTTFNLENKDTTMEEYQKNWNGFQKGVESRVNGYNITRSQKAAILQKLAPDFARQNIEGKQNAYNRGTLIASTALQNNTETHIEQISNLPLGHPDRVGLRNKITNDLSEGLATDLNIGKYNESYVDQEIEKRTVTKRLTSASTLAEIYGTRNLIKELTSLTSEDKKALTNFATTQETRIRAEQVGALTSTLSFDELGVNITTEGQIIERRDAMLDGSAFEGRPDLKKAFNDLDATAKKQYTDAVNQRIRDMRSQLNFSQAQDDRRIKRNNEDISTDLTSRIIAQGADVPSVQEINDAAFEGVEGERLREGLKGLLERSLSADLLTDTSPKTYISTKTAIHTNAIKSLTQPFTLPHEVGKEGFAQSTSFEQGKSLIDRAGAQDGYNFDDYTELANLILDREKATQSQDAMTKKVEEDAFNDFLQGNKQRIMGYSGLQKLDLSADGRFYDFSVFMRRRYRKALADGKDYIDLLDPRSPDYILKDPDKFALSFKEQIKLVGKQLKEDQPALSDIAPPQQRAGESITDYLIRTDEYWKSEDWTLYQSLRPQETR